VNHLIACAGCARHVRASESVCLFCGEALPASLRARSPRLPTERLGRAATFVFGAAVATSAAIGCGDGTSDTDTDAGPGSGADAGFDAGNIAPPYGLPPEDSGPGDEDAGPGDEDAGPGDEDAGFDAGNIAPPYGLPPDDGGAAPAPAYGTPAPSE